MPAMPDADTADRAGGEVDVLLPGVPTLRRRFPREIARTGEGRLALDNQELTSDN